MIGMHNACPPFRWGEISRLFECRDGSEMSEGLALMPVIPRMNDSKGA